MQERVKITVEDGIAEVRLNRPEKMNALDAAMFEGITAAGERLRDMVGLRAVVLCGEGRAFCAGIDLTGFEKTAGQENPIIANLSVRSHGIANEPQHICTLWRTLPVPVIAAIHGVAFGGGLQLALGADIRIVAPDARLSIMEVKWASCRIWRASCSCGAFFVTTWRAS
jgi:enoyl-CoA hydratase/carnithine racemase